MKLHVITNAQGKVLGTSKSGPSQPGAPALGRFIPADGQKVHDIEVPDELSNIKDAGELHKAVEKHIPKK